MQRIYENSRNGMLSVLFSVRAIPKPHMLILFKPQVNIYLLYTSKVILVKFLKKNLVLIFPKSLVLQYETSSETVS